MPRYNSNRRGVVQLFVGHYTSDWWELPTDRHNQGGNLSFLDGHADYKHWKFLKKFKRYQQRATTDLEDLRWLQRKLPYD